MIEKGSLWVLKNDSQYGFGHFLTRPDCGTHQDSVKDPPCIEGEYDCENCDSDSPGTPGCGGPCMGCPDFVAERAYGYCGYEDGPKDLEKGESMVVINLDPPQVLFRERVYGMVFFGELEDRCEEVK